MPGYEVDNDTPFAELWMGTHPSGPSVVMGTGPNHNNVTLLNCLSSYPEYVGNIRIVTKYGRNLPFLFKVLSVRTALSIQAHPNKALAEKLHHDDPFHYPDANHKPELAIALTEFEAFCGFRPYAEIEFLLNNVPEFKDTVGSQPATEFLETKNKDKQSLKKLFAALMTAQEDLWKENIAKLKDRWSSQLETIPELATLQKLVKKLSADFPEDIGLFAIFFLNYLVLQPGEAIYLGQDEPHAYILGDCIECMACSDNVVRAGLTPKFKDVKTLCEMLTYKSLSPKDQTLQPITIDRFTRSYIVPVPEFVVDQIEINEQDLTPSFEYKLESKESGSILIAIHGEASLQRDDKLFAGYVGFIPASTSLIINNVKSRLLLYRAYCRLDD
ncbi:hypothetical protein RDWZM_001046 [Blomia tropicalis]|uniref:mannose-6-phosphate isomerase n=1 Tax=Blomia tropicalis TaxID=40697 RepID=A0A9Q0RQ90_BLOTA|nr:hypothetical protein RDWZM_001046 [Blomia tropicalis]